MRRYVYALAAATIMSAAMPVMAEETSTEEETSIEVDGTEESATGEAFQIAESSLSYAKR